MHAVQRCLKAVTERISADDVCFEGKSKQFSSTSEVAIPGEQFSSDHISLLHRSSTEAILEIYMRLTSLMFHCDLNWKAGASSYANAFASEITLLCINRPRFSCSFRALRTSEAENSSWLTGLGVYSLLYRPNLHHIGLRSFVPS